MLLHKVLDEEEYHVLFSGIEVCYAITIYYVYFKLVCWRVSDGKLKIVFYDGQQDIPAGSIEKALLSCLQVYPCRWLILSEIMWSIYSIAMLLSNKLRCFDVVYCPFQYGIISLFCMPQMKKPADPNWNGEFVLVCFFVSLFVG